MNQNVPHDAEITEGIRKWEKFKQGAEEALQRAKVAEEETAYLKGQNELLREQMRSVAMENQRLREKDAEHSMFIAHIAEIFKGEVQKLSLGDYRKPGSARQPEQIRTPMITEIENEVAKLNRTEAIKPMSLPPMNMTGSGSKKSK